MKREFMTSNNDNAAILPSAGYRAFKISREHYAYDKIITEIEKAGFNTLVICATVRLSGQVADWETVGRLVQVRKKAGSFETDVFLIRRFDGSLYSFHNEAVFTVADRFIDYYESFFETDYRDATDETYDINGKYSASGFVVVK